MKKRNILITVLVMVVLALGAFFLVSCLTGPVDSNASEFMTRIKEGEVTAVDINNDEIVYTYKGQQYVAVVHQEDFNLGYEGDSDIKLSEWVQKYNEANPDKKITLTYNNRSEANIWSIVLYAGGAIIAIILVVSIIRSIGGQNKQFRY